MSSALGSVAPIPRSSTWGSGTRGITAPKSFWGGRTSALSVKVRIARPTSPPTPPTLRKALTFPSPTGHSAAHPERAVAGARLGMSHLLKVADNFFTVAGYVDFQEARHFQVWGGRGGTGTKASHSALFLRSCLAGPG